MKTHLIIPDVQAHEGTGTQHLKALGRYIVEHKPDTIICIGDFADMPSLCSYDKGKKSFEGRRYKKDIKAARQAMQDLLQPLKEYNQRAAELHRRRYKPELVMCLGNHEERINRVGQLDAALDGVVSIQDLGYEEEGWTVYPFNEMVVRDGVSYVHYVKNKNAESPRASTRAALMHLMDSFVCGHNPELEIYTHHRGDGKQIWGIRVGAFYIHDEDYRGDQGNKHWRGFVVAHNVEGGTFDPQFVSVDSLLKGYENV